MRSDFVSRPDDATGLSARDLARGLRSRELGVGETLELFVARALSVQTELNPFTWFADQTGRQVIAAQEAIDAGRARPLEGVPLAVKELTAVQGQPHTLGSLFLKDNVADVTDPAIQRLIDAGAIPFVRTNTPEFGCASITDNLLFGETLNPWNSEFSPAGSSGGAAAALATFSTPLAQGTDSAGSLRIPAAACGVVGFKPSFGVVPILAPLYLDRVGHNGPMARTVDDVRMMFEVMASIDTAHLAGYAPHSSHRRDQAALKVALITGIPEADVDHDVLANLVHCAELLRGGGATVAEVQFPWSFSRLFEAVKLSYAQLYAPAARGVIDAGGQVSDLTEAFVASVMPYAQDYRHVLQANAEMAILHEKFGAILAEYDVILMPTLAMPAPVAHDHFIDHGPIVNGREHVDRWIVAFTVPFNLTSSCPAISVPSGFSRDGVPTAVQIVGRPYGDNDLLDFAAYVESLVVG